VTGVYTDNDIPAYSGRKRPRCAALSEAIGRRAVDVVVAWAPERLHRSPRELEDFLELLERTGCAVETVKAGTWDVSSSHGRLVARMLGAVSRAESERTGERVSRAHQQAKANGRWRGPIPYGMRASNKPGLPEPDPEQTPIVLDIFTRTQRGDAMTKIASDLNTEGVLPRRGAAWTHTRISRLIACPAPGGLVEVDGELHDAAFAGIVTSEDWRSARAAVRRRPCGERSRPREVLSLLGGILTCDEHGTTCFAATRGTMKLYGASAPGRCFVSMSRRAADEIITNLVIERLRLPDAAEVFRPHTDGDALDRQIAEHRHRREEIADLLADGLLSASTARPPAGRHRGSNRQAGVAPLPHAHPHRGPHRPGCSMGDVDHHPAPGSHPNPFQAPSNSTRRGQERATGTAGAAEHPVGLTGTLVRRWSGTCRALTSAVGS